MAEWTPEASEYLEGYLRQVAALARHQGDDVDDIVDDLRDHAVQEAEAVSGPMVTIEHLRKVLATIGSPEQVAGVESGLVGNGEAGSLRATIAHLHSQPAGDRVAPPQPPAAPAPRHRPSCLQWVVTAAAIFFVILGVMVLLGYMQFRSIQKAGIIGTEKGVVKMMQNIAEAQHLAYAEGAFDADGDGEPDYATLQQLTERDIQLGGEVDNVLRRGYIVNLVVKPSGTNGGAGYFCEAEPICAMADRYSRFVVGQDGFVQTFPPGWRPPDGPMAIKEAPSAGASVEKD